jgi:hypothetical protein
MWHVDMDSDSSNSTSTSRHLLLRPTTIDRTRLGKSYLRAVVGMFLCGSGSGWLVMASVVLPSPLNGWYGFEVAKPTGKPLTLFLVSESRVHRILA